MLCGAGTAYLYPSEWPEFTPDFLWGSCCVIFSFLWSLFVLLFFCLSFSDLQLLVTSLISFDYSFDIFWLPLWYLLVTSLISFDYPFGIFWLPLWYLLVTSDICWLPLRYLLITPLVSSSSSYYAFLWKEIFFDLQKKWKSLHLT